MIGNSQKTPTAFPTSLFEAKLPEWYEQMQSFHEKIRSGMFWRITQEQARADYVNAVAGTSDTPLSQEMANLMDNQSVAVNRILAYIEQEFADYRQLMEARFREYAEICRDFSDAEYTGKIQERLARNNLDTIEITLSHNGSTETVSIGNARNLSLSLRYKAFWGTIEEAMHHKREAGCNIEVANIEFCY